jgi:membrane protein
MEQTLREIREAGSLAAQSLARFGTRVGRGYPALGQVARFVREVLRKYHHDDCLSYAASISFFLTISLIPLATMFFKLMGYMLGSGAYSVHLQRALFQLYPYLPHGFINDSIQNSRKLGGLGFGWIVLLVGAHWGVNQLDRSLSHIFGLRIKVHRQTRKHPLLRRMVVVLGLLVGLVLALAAGLNWSLLSRVPAGSLGAIRLLPALFALVFATLVLQYLPRCHVQLRHSLLGALTFTVLWTLARTVFAWYLKHTPTWGILYGSLGGVMAALVFLYYTCAIFMLGAEVTAAFYRQGSTGAFPFLRR